MYPLLERRVQIARRFVQYQQIGVLQQGASDGDSLSLAAGEFDSLIAKNCVVAVRQLVEELGYLGDLACPFDRRLRSIAVSDGDVPSQAVVEHVRVLPDDGDSRSPF